jgi:hypothetical protein
MPMTITGAGTITGISVGGLPDGIITVAELDGNQSGAAPAYACRAWVAHEQGTVNGSGNVSSVTTHATGDQTINFTTAMQDANYGVVHAGGRQATAWGFHLQHPSVAKATTGYRYKNVTPADNDTPAVNQNLAFFR